MTLNGPGRQLKHETVDVACHEHGTTVSGFLP